MSVATPASSRSDRREVEMRPPLRRSQFRGPRRDEVGDLLPGVAPDFLIIGAQKAGTTTLHHMLASHPQVFMSRPKEIHFFDGRRHWPEGLDWYRAHFPPQLKATRHWLAGESSPAYLYVPEVPPRVGKLLPDVRSIVLLRNPIDRALSQWAFFRFAQKKERLDFGPALRKALKVDEARRRGKHVGTNHYSYLSRGYYAEQLQRWWQHVPREQMLVLHSADFSADPAGTLSQVQQWLGVDVAEPPKMRNFNVGGMGKDAMTPKLREFLREHYEPHNERLYQLLGRDFGWT